MRFEGGLEIKQTVQKVFDYVTNMEHLPEWSGFAIAVRQSTQGQLREGDRFTSINKFLGRRFEIIYDITSYEPNLRFSYWSTDWLVPLGATFTFGAVPEGMRLTQIQKVELGTIFRLAEPLLAAMGRRRLNNDLVTLKDLLEAQG